MLMCEIYREMINENGMFSNYSSVNLNVVALFYPDFLRETSVSYLSTTSQIQS